MANNSKYDQMSKGHHSQHDKKSENRHYFQVPFQKFKQELQDSFLTPDRKMIKPGLLDQTEILAKSLPRDKDTVNQVRRYFNQVLGLVSKDEDILTIELKMLKARVRYGVGRETISRDFSDLLVQCLDTVMQATSIKEQLVLGFRPFFESLYAYYYFYNKKRKKK